MRPLIHSVALLAAVLAAGCGSSDSSASGVPELLPPGIPKEASPK